MAGYMHNYQYEVSASKVINHLRIAKNKKYPAEIKDGVITFFYEKEDY